MTWKTTLHIQTRLEQMWFWSYTSRSTKRDYISNLTSALTSYDDHDHNHDREEDYDDKDNNDDYDYPNHKDNHKKQMPDQDRVFL